MSLSQVGTVGLAIFTIVVWRVYRRSALDQIPSVNFLARWTRLPWSLLAEVPGLATIRLPGLHSVMGPLIQIGPSEVSFYSMDIYDTVYRAGSKFRKDPRNYGGFVQAGHPSIFSICDPADHAKRRSIIAKRYRKSEMHSVSGLISTHLEEWVHSERWSSDMELGTACRALEADIIADFSFGLSINAVAEWSAGQHSVAVEANDEKAKWLVFGTLMPILERALQHIRHHVALMTGARSQLEGLKAFDDWAASASRQAISQGVEGTSLINILLAAGLPEGVAISESKENLGPGTDTTSSSLAHILWALAHDPPLQAQLHTQLQELGFPHRLEDLECIPLLSACVKEGIRWAGAASAVLPRVVPKGGVELSGIYIPENTIVSTSPIWYLRDPVAFPEPTRFNPFRWVSRDGTRLVPDAMRDRYYIPFSKGANVCIGSNLAYYELYLSVSRVIQRFELRPSGAAGGGIAATDGEQGVDLPPRREWVAAVPSIKLGVTATKRAS